MPELETKLLVFKQSAIDRTGAFAKKKISRGTRIIEYVGEKIDKAESAKRCEAENYYIFTLDDDWDIDGDKDWNPAKYINHSCEPNAESQIVDGHIWIFAIDDIEPGEEVTMNYGYDLENYKEHICRCGAPSCLGYMVAEEFFDHIRQLNASTGRNVKS
ncbi:MAG: SET domain-containing protein [Limisphaerales bacterium]